MQQIDKNEQFLVEIENNLLEQAKGIDPGKAAERARFMKAVMPMLGLPVPLQRARLKKGYSFSDLSFEEQIPIWEYVWFHARSHEAKMQAAFFVEKPKDYDPEWLWSHLSSWVRGVNCWDQSDTLSNVYSRLNEDIPHSVVPRLQKWNVSDNPWERRQSLVALLFYSRFRQILPDQALVFALVKARLEDADYYVQKGVGWTLREAWNVWPVDCEAFLHLHVKQLAPAAWQAATEKLSAPVKAELKARRKGR